MHTGMYQHERKLLRNHATHKALKYIRQRYTDKLRDLWLTSVTQQDKEITQRLIS